MEKQVREAFLAERRKGIGGSDVAAIFGLDRYRTPEDVWLEKTGQFVPADEPSGDKERGIRLEPFAAQLYMEKYGDSVVELHRIEKPFIHPEYPWMRGNVDRIGTPKMIESNFVAEIKCPSLGMYSKIKREGLPDSWKLQGQHYLSVTGLGKLVWIIFCADRWELLTFEQERDELVIDRIIEKEREFWTLVETMTPPPPFLLHAEGEPETEVVGQVTKRRDPEFAEAVAQLRQAKELAATAKQIEEQAQARIGELTGNKYGIYEGPGARFYIKEQPGRETFDMKAMAQVNLIKKEDALIVLGEILSADKLPDMMTIDEALTSHQIDLGVFKKRGKSFSTFRSYFYGD